MAQNFFNDLYVSEGRYGHIKAAEENAWMTLPCPSCRGNQAVLVAYVDKGSAAESRRPLVLWTRCVNCFRGAVINMGTVSPSALPLRDVRGLEADTQRAWDEVRGCLSVGAPVAATHMCRKILLHVAVEKGLPAKNAKDFAPSFEECLTHLKKEGYVTPPMADWVKKIRDVGNEAAHELDGPDNKSALLVAEFTLQLLILTYEMPAAMKDRSPTPPPSEQH